jgi:hypothetical protein
MSDPAGLLLTAPHSTAQRHTQPRSISRPSTRAADYLRERIRGGRAGKCVVALKFHHPISAYNLTVGVHMLCTSEDPPPSWVEGITPRAGE